MGDTVSIRQVEVFTKKKISQLLEQSGSNSGILAQLRRGIGKEPGEMPQLWGYFLQDMPEEFFGRDEPSRAEWAVYSAVTLFALHQQGKDGKTEPMQRDGMTLGRAIAQLVTDEDEEKRVTRRFQTVATASSVGELCHYLRSLVQMLRGENIGLDYPLLAKDIYCFQFPELISKLRLRWGQDFYANLKVKSTDNK